MDWTELAKQVAKIGLPLLGAVLPVPGGAAIGSALAAAIGSPSGSPADIMATLTQSADALAKAREFEAAHQATMLKLTLDAQAVAIQADTADRASARQREIATKDRVPAALAFVVTIGFFTVLAYMIRFGTPKEGGDAFLVMLGSLGTAWTAVISYYFGSSLSSAKKDSALAAR